MGVFLYRSGAIASFNGLPHVRGGVSKAFTRWTTLSLSSPRAWGCFVMPPSSSTLSVVFPTCVGVFLVLLSSFFFLFGLPHVRGGVSQCKPEIVADVVSSPRAWGCFSLRRSFTALAIVFPTCVGVFQGGR